MKVLSKYFKVALCFVAFALCSFMFAFTPTTMTAIHAAEVALEQYKVAIDAIKMPTEQVDRSKNEEFRVPLLNASVEGATSYTIRVVDPTGNNHDYKVGTSENGTFFELKNDEDEDYLLVKAKNDGDYKVVYIVTSGSKVYYSNAYTVSVKNVTYELDLSTPVVDSNKEIVGYTKNLMKTNLKVGEAYVLPVAYAKETGKDLAVDGDGKPSDQVAQIKVRKNGAPQKENEEGSVLKEASGVYTLTPNEEGVYTVEYSFNNSANRPTKTYTIEVSDDFVASELKLASTPTMPKIELGKEVTLPKLTLNAGDRKNVDVNIKEVKIVKENSGNAIKCVLKDNNLKFKMSPENFDGVDNYQDMVGNYRVEYTVEDAYGKILTQIFRIDNVTVSSNPTIKLAYDYDASKLDTVEPIFGAEIELKAEYEKGASFMLPAVYVEDTVSKYEDLFVVRAIRMSGGGYYYVDNVRYDEDEGKLVEVTGTQRNASYKETFQEGVQPDFSKRTEFSFAEGVTEVAGKTFYLEYRVYSKEVKDRNNSLYIDGTKDKYSFKIVAPLTGSEEEIDAAKPVPELEILNLRDSAVKNTDAVTVKVSSKDDKDTRLKNAVFTFTGRRTDKNTDVTLEKAIEKAIVDVQAVNGYAATSNILDNDAFVKYMNDNYTIGLTIVEEDETKNSFTLDLKEMKDEVKVLAVALNDHGKVATQTRTLTIKDTTNDTTAPKLNIKADDTDAWYSMWVTGKTINQDKEVGQGVDVALPVLYAVDADNTLSLNVSYYIDKNEDGKPENSFGAIEYKSPIGKKFFRGQVALNAEAPETLTEVQFINGGTITTSETGTYYVAYTATDVAGNTSVMYFTFKVVDTSKPILTVNPVANDAKIAGNTLTASKGTEVDFEAILRSADGKKDYTDDAIVEISIDDGGKSLDYQTSGSSKNSYVFNDYGTYTITVSASYKTTVDKTETTLTADSKIIKVVIEQKAIEWLGEFDVPTYAQVDKEGQEPIKLPAIAASNGANVQVTYQVPNSTSSEAQKATLETDENGYSYWTFPVTAEGTYTVKYVATTNDNTLTKTFSIKVGDNVPPVMEFKKGDLTRELVYDGEHDIEYVLEVSTSKKTFVVKVVNNGEEVYSRNIDLKITDKDDSGDAQSINWSTLTYELTGPNVTKGEVDDNSETKVKTTQYLISGTGEYTLKLTVSDDDGNEKVEKVSFNVVKKSETKENKDSVVGAVLIVISLVLLAGVILFFTFTGTKGKKSSTKTTKTKTNKTPKTKPAKEVKAEKEEVKEEKVEAEVVEEAQVEETKAEVIADETAENEVVVEETKEEVVETEPEVEQIQMDTATEETSSNDDEPKTGEVE